jgi:hypothetical protein
VNRQNLLIGPRRAFCVGTLLCELKGVSMAKESDFSALSREELETRLLEITRGRPRRKRLVLMALLTVALIGAGLVADWYSRNRELDRLLAAVEKSETVMVSARDGFRSAARPYSGQPFLSNEQRSQLREQVTSVASDGAAQVIATGDSIRDIQVLPWHRSINKARDRYLAHSNAWRDYLTDVARDPAQVGQANPEISGTFVSAKRAFEEAVPLRPLHDLEARADRIFAD